MQKSRAATVGFLTVALSAPLGLAAAPAAFAAPTTSFTLNATVLDAGEQVTSITLDTARHHVDPRSLDVDTFQVHATGTNPYSQVDARTVLGTYDQYRTVTGVHLDRKGNIVIDLLSGPDAPAAFTFAYGTDVDTKVSGRNLSLDLTYTVTQRKAFKASGRPLTFGAFRQGRTVDHEVEAYEPGTSASGLNYQLYLPDNARRHAKKPLVVWLHGGGEGGWSGAQDTTLPLRANRGALAFSAPKAQKAFGGAYVVAPQATDYWMNDSARGYTPKLKALVDELVKQYPIDRHRIYVVGASNGGYETLALETAYPKYFAAAVPTCPGVEFQGAALLTNDQLRKARTTPTWIVQSTSDPVLPFARNGGHAASVIGNAHLTTYPDVVWQGHTYNAHWSWIYVAHNDPRLGDGTRLFTWMARQHR